MATELIFMAVSVRKAAIIWKETAGLTGAKLMEVLIRDQVMYFAAYVSLCIKPQIPLNLSSI